MIFIEKLNICINIINSTPIVNIGCLNDRISSIGCFKDNWRFPKKINAINPITKTTAVDNKLELPAELTEYIIPAKPIVDSSMDK